MKSILTVSILAGMAVSAEAQNIHRREVRQQARIAQGARSGALTAAEVRALERREAAAHRGIVRDRIDGGGLTAVERARIDNRQDRLSNQIHRLKNNGRAR
jgi:hypothetical protein